MVCRASLPMGFSRQGCWSSLPFPSPGYVPNPGVELRSPALQVNSLPSEKHAGKSGKSLQSCPTLRDPMDCSPPGSSVHGIFQARVLEWGAITFSRNSINGVSLSKPNNAGSTLMEVKWILLFPPQLQTWYSWLTSGQYLMLSSHLIGKHKNTYLKNLGGRGCPGGSVVKNPPGSTGDKGSIPGPGRSHMLWSD